ncbi:MAG: aminoglycoside/choline kinase family phosphotransferase [Cellvibrionaceae bacterium]|jgi:aminoglycoside/choline kinase family phosphotransferase
MSLTESKLQAWVSAQLQQRSDVTYTSPIELQPLSGDAGCRQYFRLHTHPSLLAVSAPKTEGVSECARYFTGLSGALREAGVPTPQVLTCDEDQNFLLIEDFGGQSYLDCLNDETADVLYGQALMVLLRLQQIPRSSIALPSYGRSMLRQEMALFDHWFVEQMLAYQLSIEERELLDKTYSFLEQQALEQPQVMVHRDYHSRNIIYREGEAPGVIDFQDAVWGPITYDVVSLLRDCYISWSPEQVKRWSVTYGNLALELGVMPAVSEHRWQYWMDTMGLQRHIKVLGIFARLSLRDGKPQYLSDLPLVWKYTVDIAQQYPETKVFADWCQQKLLPLVELQPWYSASAITGDCT